MMRVERTKRHGETGKVKRMIQLLRSLFALPRGRVSHSPCLFVAASIPSL